MGPELLRPLARAKHFSTHKTSNMTIDWSWYLFCASHWLCYQFCLCKKVVHMLTVLVNQALNIACNS